MVNQETKLFHFVIHFDKQVQIEFYQQVDMKKMQYNIVVSLKTTSIFPIFYDKRQIIINCYVLQSFFPIQRKGAYWAPRFLQNKLSLLSFGWCSKIKMLWKRDTWFSWFATYYMKLGAMLQQAYKSIASLIIIEKLWISSLPHDILIAPWYFNCPFFLKNE